MIKSIIKYLFKTDKTIKFKDANRVIHDIDLNETFYIVRRDGTIQEIKISTYIMYYDTYKGLLACGDFIGVYHNNKEAKEVSSLQNKKA